MTKISYLSLFHAHFLVKQQRNTAPYWNRTLKLLGLILLLLVFLVPASLAQNTKGDKPQTGAGSKRDNRFKSSKKKKVKDKKSYNRAQANKSSKAGKASSQSKIYSQKGPFVNKGSRTAKDQRQNLKSSTNRSRVGARSSSSKTRNAYPQQGPYVNNPSRVPDGKPPRVTSNKSTTRRVTSQSKSIGSKNVHSQRGPYVNNPSKRSNDKPRFSNTYPPGYRRVKTPPKDSQQKNRVSTTPHYGVRSVSGQRKNVYQQKGPFVHNPSQKAQKQKQRIVSNKSQVARVSGGSQVSGPEKGRKRKGAISASRPYVSRKSINAFAGFWNKKPKGEKAYTSGDLAGHKLRKKNYQTKMPVIVNPTAHPYKSKKSLGDKPYSGPTKGGYKTATKPGKAWSGDIAGRKIKGRNLSSKKTVQAGQPVFPPKKTKQKIGDTPYKGTIPGGGAQSATGTFKKSTGRLPVKRPLSAGGAGFSGNLKARKAAKGGGSVSGKGWNNEGQPLIGTAPLRRNVGYALFSGNKKTRVAPKGGGSVSGGLWNNQNKPLVGKTPSSSALQAGAFSGNIKARKKTPDTAVGGFSPRKYRDQKPAMRDQGEEYTGHLKAHKPGKAPHGQPAIETYQGNMRVSKKEPSKAVGGTSPRKYLDQKPALHDQGEEFTGFIKLPRFKKAYIKNPNSAEASLKKVRPDKTTYKVNDLQVKVKEQKYGKKPNAAEGSMKGIVASKSSIKASEYSKVLRLKYAYIHNPSSSKEALKTREPGKAFARESDYQGNIKMKKFDLFGKKDLHPDAKFVKTNKNNVASERSLLTNFKLAWAKLFGKNDLQPGGVKEKERKPRYDKGEDGLWYDKHNSGGDNSRRRAKAEGQ